MNARKKTSLIASCCLVASLTASTAMVRVVDRLRPQATLQETIFVDSPKIIRRASLGYTGLMACIYWTRAVQYFGGHHHASATHYSLLAPLLNITTELDPKLLFAYEFGAIFLAPKPPDGAGKPQEAIRLINYGIEQNPDNWHLYYDLGFIYYMDLKDYGKAADAFARGAQVPNANALMHVWAAQMAQHAGEINTARMLWTITLQSSHQQEIRENAIDHLRALQVDDDVMHLQQAVTQFGENTGRLPASMAELSSFLRLRGIPVDPEGQPYILNSDGRVLVADPDNFRFVTQGLPPGYKPKYRDTPQ